MRFWKRENRNGLNRGNVGTGLVPVLKKDHRRYPDDFNYGFMKKGFYKRKNPRLKGFDYSQPFAYFITICAKDKRIIFRDEGLNQDIINCLKQEREKTGVKVFVYCLMPDHFHMLISPLSSGMNISRFIANFKGRTTRIGWKYGIKEKM